MVSRISIEEMIKRDHLGKAAEAGRKAKGAIKNKKYDEAWGLLHEQKFQYMEHANLNGFNMEQTLALDADVHEHLANILRLENKHKDALTHILYWVAAQNHRPKKSHEKKLASYFNRCKLKNTTLEDAFAFSSNVKGTSFIISKNKITEWFNDES
jgi:hypothetical protein